MFDDRYDSTGSGGWGDPNAFSFGEQSRNPDPWTGHAPSASRKPASNGSILGLIVACAIVVMLVAGMIAIFA